MSSSSARNLRHRNTFAEGSSVDQNQNQNQNNRRNSILSDSVSEARNTIRSSTDDLFFPRAANTRHHFRDDESHWHSAPLGLALLPAIAGIFFQNGSSVVTDVTLLALAAVFLNWSVRLPWDWYRSARTIQQIEDTLYDSAGLSDSVELDTTSRNGGDSSQSAQGPQESQPSIIQKSTDMTTAASRELQIHELAALASCFIFPIIGTWLLHTIRSNLSRPSEGLVSNYNLTIFLLAAEIRPLSHLLKMVQARTLHLQRIVASSDDDKEKIDVTKILDISKRLEELEAHVAEAAASRLAASSTNPTQQPEQSNPSAEEQEQEQEHQRTQSLISQATAEFQKGFRQDIDALNRAVRRYEKRTALASFQTESRLQALEANFRHVLSQVAAAQHSTSHRSRGLVIRIRDWISGVVVLPARIAMALVRIPLRITRWVLLKGEEVLLGGGSSLGSVRGRRSRSSSKSKGKSPQTRKLQPPHQKRPKRTSIPEE